MSLLPIHSTLLGPPVQMTPAEVHTEHQNGEQRGFK